MCVSLIQLQQVSLSLTVFVLVDQGGDKMQIILHNVVKNGLDGGLSGGGWVDHEGFKSISDFLIINSTS